MDETQQSRASDAAAAASRKRRSSILKSQRPPRTPFSELEFHVATPTDTAKSRRVSFSRRTGVAEFITNEATTTWKNFYEEHNKSLESSGNDSGAHAPKQTISHLGKRIFDQQFQEVEAIDFMTSIDNHSSRNINTSLNKVNFTQQLASLECTAGEKSLLNPQTNLEMSAFTDCKSNVFGEDFALPTMGEMSGRIDVNFSAVQNIGSTSEIKDDLDQIQEDLRNAKNNVVCPGPFNDRRSLSEYIEVDFNSTRVVNDESDMSITDTIHSPKVQEVSKSSSIRIDKIPVFDNYWVADKENIAVFEGCTSPVKPASEKRKTIVYENDTGNISITQALPVNIILPEQGKSSERRKTIVYDSDSADISVTQAVPVNIMIVNKDKEKRKTIIYENDTGNISVTQAISSTIILPDKNKTIISQDDLGNISITQANPIVKIISSNVSQLSHKSTITDDLISNVPSVDDYKHKTIIYGNESVDYSEFDNNMSITKPIVTKHLYSDDLQKSMINELLNISNKIGCNMNKSNLSKSNTQDLFIYQAEMVQDLVAKNSSQLEHSRSEDSSDVGRFKKRTSLSFAKTDSNESYVELNKSLQTQPRLLTLESEKPPENLVSDQENYSLNNWNDNSKGTPSNTTENKLAEKRHTVIDDLLDMSQSSLDATLDNNDAPVTISQKQIVTTDSADNQSNDSMNINDIDNETQTEKVEDMVIRDSKTIKESEEPLALEYKEQKRKTIVYENDTGNISITQALPVNIILPEQGKSSERRKTIVYDSDSADISVTQAVPVNIMIVNKDKEKRKTIIYENDKGNISVTQAISSTIILPDKNKTIISQDDLENISITQANPIVKIISSNVSQLSHKSTITDDLISNVPSVDDYKHKTIIYGNESVDYSEFDNNMSITKPIVTKHLYSDDLQKSMINELLNISNKIGCNMNKSNLSKSNTQDLFIYQAEMVQDLVAKNSSQLEHSRSEDSSDVGRFKKRTSLSFAKTDSNESYVELNKSLQTQPRLLTLESEKPPENLVSDQENYSLNNWNDNSKGTPSNTTENKLAEKRHTVIDDLLDMSQSSLDATLDNNDAPVTISQKQIVTTDSADNQSNDSMNINDIDNETQTEKVEDMVIRDSKTIKESEEPLALEYKEAKKANMSFDVLKKILKTKLSDIQKISAKHRQREKARKSDIEQDQPINENKSPIEENLDSSKSKNFKDADDTNELLEMLSSLTDKTRVSDVEEPKEPVSRRTSPRRLSVAPNRLSIVLSREDLLNNISMAQAALQKSMEIDESLEDTSITPTEDHSPPKPARMSNEVVKKLHFEDESGSETSVKSDIKSSPLQKTAFGDISGTKENKSKVIPNYLKDVSEDIKALMDDLVKPNVDMIPFQAVNKGQIVHKNPSQCSNQIQANLITSSQIDVNVENSNSASTSSYNLGNLSNPSFCTDSKSLKSSLKSSKTEKPDGLKVICPKMASPSTASDKVLIFDHNNPLNNVLLAPPDYSNAHRYQPGWTVISANGSESDGLEKNPSSSNTGNLNGKITQYNVESVLLSSSMAQSNDIYIDSSFNNDSKSMSNRESVRVRELIDTKVNTLIAMKQNKDLLESSSSLTLVDDTVTTKNFDVDLDKESQNNRKSSSRSNTKSLGTLIYQNDEQESDISKTKSDEKEEAQSTKPKKRNYSPTKRDKTKHSGRLSLDNTPKQISKMQKLSFSPYQSEKQMLNAEKDDENMDIDTSFNTKKSSPVSKKASPRKSKGGKNITVQQLLTEYDFEGNIDEKALSEHIIKALSQSRSSSIPNTASVNDLEIKSLDDVSSFTSSKNQMEMRDACSVTTTDTKSSVSRSDWQPEAKENGSVAVSECDSSVNVVAKIDMLPFMGSHECEWEPSSSDTWSFRLLHARVRLTMRLAHRHDNATRTRVRADTPVLAVALDVAQFDKKNTVASHCVNFAAETMRHYIARGCSKAGEVPALLRRCAGAARVALRWGRAMHEARLHLAYTLREDGSLALKVANIPLRSVWEVIMRLELVTEPNAAPWPRAYDVTVTRVVSDIRVTSEEVKKLLSNVPRDWGHVPRTIWKIFRYLKNKTSDDELLGLS